LEKPIYRVEYYSISLFYSMYLGRKARENNRSKKMTWRDSSNGGGGSAGGNFVDSRCWVAWERGNK
jgi:hypothetical protein